MYGCSVQDIKTKNLAQPSQFIGSLPSFGEGNIINYLFLSRSALPFQLTNHGFRSCQKVLGKRRQKGEKSR